MMNKIKFLLASLLSLVFSTANATEISVLEETFFQSGKIYVVVAVCLVILIGIFVYLFRTERTLKALEKEVYEKTK
ncbi:MAG: CcmD family protein [Flavobacteriales bacterium]|nr:CcmD family protein [Flavobacteriales bacterium]MDG1780663.1 CcmD family protein [Flavobacteriales bacterium]